MIIVFGALIVGAILSMAAGGATIIGGGVVMFLRAFIQGGREGREARKTAKLAASEAAIYKPARVNAALRRSR